MASERMGLGRSWQQRFDRRPDSIEHVGLERAHDVGDLHLVVGWGAPNSQIGTVQRPVDGRLSARPLCPDQRISIRSGLCLIAGCAPLERSIPSAGSCVPSAAGCGPRSMLRLLGIEFAKAQLQGRSQDWRQKLQETVVLTSLDSPCNPALAVGS
jgi:hypothetical protein